MRAQSFERTTHNEATKLRRVFVPAGVRECKEQTAPGEVPSKLLSDRGSIPLGSTNKKDTQRGVFFIGKVELWGIEPI